MAQAQDPRSDSSSVVWLIISRAVWALFWLMPAALEVVVFVGVMSALRQALWLNVGVYLAFAFILAVGYINAWRRYHGKSDATPENQ